MLKSAFIFPIFFLVGSFHKLCICINLPLKDGPIFKNESALDDSIRFKFALKNVSVGVKLDAFSLAQFICSHTSFIAHLRLIKCDKLGLFRLVNKVIDFSA